MGDFSNDTILSRRRWKQVQILSNQVWYRWIQEYLTTLHLRQKCIKPQREVRVGDIVLLYRYWYLRTIFLVWKAVSWFVLNERYPIRIMKRFFHTWKNRFVQSVRACVYIAVNSFTAGKLFGEIFFKLLAVSCGWKSILDLNSTRWAISHVYKDLQFYKKPKIYFSKRNMQAKDTAVIPKQTAR